jgi:hypothetical protein|tara:strand:+ start:516 stop:695 length:180 start_codon:yes stop_codon:yes gene_type:complete
MKLGDLITLSAYGQKLTFLSKRRNKVGLVIEKYPHGTYKVRWQCGEDAMMERKDIKKAK